MEITVLEGSDLRTPPSTPLSKKDDPIYAKVYAGGKIYYQKIETRNAREIKALSIEDYKDSEI